MCAVSMIGDYYTDKWGGIKIDPSWYPGPNQTVQSQQVSYADFQALKKEVEEMKALLLRAKKYDEDNNEPHCEMDEKVDLLKKVASLVGVDLEEVFGGSPTSSL